MKQLVTYCQEDAERVQEAIRLDRRYAGSWSPDLHGPHYDAPIRNAFYKLWSGERIRRFEYSFTAEGLEAERLLEKVDMEVMPARKASVQRFEDNHACHRGMVAIVIDERGEEYHIPARRLYANEVGYVVWVEGQVDFSPEPARQIVSDRQIVYDDNDKRILRLTCGHLADLDDVSAPWCVDVDKTLTYICPEHGAQKPAANAAGPGTPGGGVPAAGS